MIFDFLRRWFWKADQPKPGEQIIPMEDLHKAAHLCLYPCGQVVSWKAFADHPHFAAELVIEHRGVRITSYELTPECKRRLTVPEGAFKVVG
jgi:hypothetical protein